MLRSSFSNGRLSFCWIVGGYSDRDNSVRAISMVDRDIKTGVACACVVAGLIIRKDRYQE